MPRPKKAKKPFERRPIRKPVPQKLKPKNIIWVPQPGVPEEAGIVTQAKMQKDYAKHHYNLGLEKKEDILKQKLGGFHGGMERLQIHLSTLSDHPVKRYKQLKESKKIYKTVYKEYLQKAQTIKDPQRAAQAIKHMEKHYVFFHEKLDQEMKRLELKHKDLMTHFIASDLVSKMDPKISSKIVKNLRHSFQETLENGE
ncbi:hypothetical protein K8R43_05855 [archaeon]|nr:hypothetical protein [archaeon]